MSTAPLLDGKVAVLPAFSRGGCKDGAEKGAWTGLRRSLENHAKKSASDRVSRTELWLMVG